MQDSRGLGHPGGVRSRRSRLALVGLTVAVLSGLALGAAGLGYRASWWRLSTAFSIFRWGAYGGAAGAAVSLAAALMSLSTRRAVSLGILGVVIGSLVFAVPWRWRQTVRTVPPIHDITTDLDNPPAFVAILPLRVKAPNPAAYGGPKVAAAQRTGYPDIGPAMLNLPPERAFQNAERAAGTLPCRRRVGALRANTPGSGGDRQDRRGRAAFQRGDGRP